jgi:hypothetical protein
MTRKTPYFCRFFSLVALAYLALLTSDSSLADRPPESTKQLKNMATHVVVGTIAKVYKNQSSLGNWKTTECVAEVIVAKVNKGNEIVAKDRIFVKYYYKDWIGQGEMSETDWLGQRGFKAASPVLLYLNGTSSQGYRVSEPNGFAVPAAMPAAPAMKAKPNNEQNSTLRG